MAPGLQSGHRMRQAEEYPASKLIIGSLQILRCHIVGKSHTPNRGQLCSSDRCLGREKMHKDAELSYLSYTFH